MDKKLYMGKLFSKRRDQLVDKCIELQRDGKRFLYIMPSSAAIFQVRKKFAQGNGGLLGSRVIVFDDLEMDITSEYISPNNIIYEPQDRVIISNVCSSLKDDLKYYGRIYNKKGFHEEIAYFIRTLKRNCISEDMLSDAQNTVEDEILKDKLLDLYSIYSGYDEVLRVNNIYDRNDVSLMAVDYVDKYSELCGLDSIIIDGFTDIEEVSMRLVEKIAALDAVNIYVNCPYKNRFIEGFINKEIAEPFEKMGFEIINDQEACYEINDDIKEVSEKLYSGEKINGAVSSIFIGKYPCIEAEVRETARSIKEKLINGEAPENIAIYLNSKDQYSKDIIDIFKEFGIPVSAAFELPIGEAEIVRKIVKAVEDNVDEALSLNGWINVLTGKIESSTDYIGELVRLSMKNDLDFAQKLELKAFDGLGKFLAEAAKSFEMCTMASEIVSKDFFMDYITEAVSSINVTLEQGNNSGIKVMNTALAKGIYYDHVYILGLNEGEVPSVVSCNGLFDIYELKSLKDCGIKYKDYVWELEREKIRFNLAMASAVKSITLSYRGSSEDGRYSIESSFIDEIKFLTGIKEKSDFSMRKRFELNINESMSSSEFNRSYIKKHFDLKYADKSLEASKRNLLDKYPDASRLVEYGNVEFHRDREMDFNNFEGVMDSEFSKISECLCKFSPSALNEYLKCPFKYLVTYLYKPGEEEEDEKEYSNLEIGDFYHSVLFEYYSLAKDFEEFDEDVFDKAFEKAKSSLRVVNISRDDLEEIIDDWYDTLRNFITADILRMENYKKVSGGNILRPYILEEMFDASRTFGAAARCKIDRVDLEYSVNGKELVPTGRYIIYDYKKKTIPELNQILGNEDCQLAIYYYVVKEELRKRLKSNNMECMALLYLSVEKSDDKVALDGIYKTEYKKALGINKRGDVNSAYFEELMSFLMNFITETVSLIKSGKFNYKPACSHFEEYSVYPCGFETLCRYSKNKLRAISEGKI